MPLVLIHKKHGMKYIMLIMAKEVGVKAERPNPLGLPDLIKPEGWTAPSHDGNHGHLPHVIQKHI
jgi:hypothetical protein